MSANINRVFSNVSDLHAACVERRNKTEISTEFDFRLEEGFHSTCWVYISWQYLERGRR